MSARQPLNDAPLPLAELRAADAVLRLAGPLTQKAARYCAAACEGHGDALYKLRVVLRRLRSLLWAFAPVLPEARVDQWRGVLARVSRDAGQARDWDLLIDTVLPQTGAALADDFAGLSELLERHRRAAHRRNRWRLAQSDLPAVLQDVMAGLEAARRKPSGKAARLALRDFAAESVRKARQALRRKADAAGGSMDDLHEARLALKRLRYLIEFFGPALPPDAADESGWLARLQDELGGLNDKVVARDHLTQALGKRRRGPAAVAALDWLDERIAAEAGRSRAGLRAYLDAC